MKILNVRSPYFIEIDEAGQVEAKVDLRIWHKGETEPTPATYTVQKNIVSTTQTNVVFNIAPFIAEKINIVSPTLATTPTIEEDYSNWVYIKADLYYRLDGEKEFDRLVQLKFVGVNGYTSYLGGYNQDNDTLIEIMLNDTITGYYEAGLLDSEVGYFNVLIDYDSVEDVNCEYTEIDGSTETIRILKSSTDPADIYMFKIPFFGPFYDYPLGSNVKIRWGGVGNFPTDGPLVFKPICEAKYTPVQCAFVNRFGGWQFLTFFKAQTNSLQVENSTFQLLPDAVDYNPLRNQFQSFNFSGKQTVTLNTGWIDEAYAEIITDLMLSETVLLDEKPVNVKTKSTALKTRLKDKNINYTIDFEYSYNLINNVV